MENWRPVPGYEGAYEVSDMGRVRSLDRTVLRRGRWGLANRRLKGKLLAPQPLTNGYVGVHLGRGKQHLVHRLVAAAFVPGFVEGLEVNHDNGIRSANTPGNLEWCTSSKNKEHAHRHLPRKKHALSRPVAVRGDGFLALFPDQSALAALLGVVPGSVASAAVRKHRVKGCEVIYV